MMTTSANVDRHLGAANDKMNRRNNPEDDKSWFPGFAESDETETGNEGCKSKQGQCNGNLTPVGETRKKRSGFRDGSKQNEREMKGDNEVPGFKKVVEGTY